MASITIDKFCINDLAERTFGDDHFSGFWRMIIEIFQTSRTRRHQSSITPTPCDGYYSYSLSGISVIITGITPVWWRNHQMEFMHIHYRGLSFEGKLQESILVTSPPVVLVPVVWYRPYNHGPDEDTIHPRRNLLYSAVGSVSFRNSLDIS